MITRRQFGGRGTAWAAGGIGAALLGGCAAASRDPAALTAALERIEAEIGGRLGVAALDTGSGARIDHRADERFPMCSTFKLLLAAAVLARVDAGQDRLERRIPFGASDLVEYSPATKPGAEVGGMTLGALCEATVTLSDNSAANLILATLDGPAGLTRWIRTLGDDVTRLDRIEPALNESLPGDPRDTTTPAAMMADIRALVLGAALSPRGRDQLTAWLIANKTGDQRLRAGLPAGWRAGEKTGTGARGSTGDVGILWPPAAAPLVVAVYLAETPAPLERRNAAFAAVARAITA